MNWIELSFALCGLCYLAQDATLFTAQREKVREYLITKMVSGGGWVWKLLHHQLICPFCLSFWINLCIVAQSQDWLSILAVPTLVSLIYRWTFK